MNNSYHESVGETPFFLNYGQHPLTPVSALVDTSVPAAAQYTTGLEQAVSRAKESLYAAQQRQKAYADAHRRDASFAVGSRVLLHTRHLRVPGGARKLMPVYIGPFSVLKRVGPVAYELELPANMRRKRIHPVFHVSLLKQYEDPGPGRQSAPPPPIEDEEGPLYRVRALLDCREDKRGTKRGPAGRRVPDLRREYLVDWEGYGPEHRT